MLLQEFRLILQLPCHFIVVCLLLFLRFCSPRAVPVLLALQMGSLMVLISSRILRSAPSICNRLFVSYYCFPSLYSTGLSASVKRPCQFLGGVIQVLNIHSIRCLEKFSRLAVPAKWLFSNRSVTVTFNVVRHPQVKLVPVITQY